jgi:opacity protein-like surface antigen
MKRIAIAAAAALLMLGTAQAQQVRTTAGSPLYGELGYSFLNVDANGLGDADPQALRGIIGYNFHPFLAAEGMLALGTRSDDINVGVGSIDVKLRNAIGLFAKPKFDFGNVQAFARLGWVRSKVRASGFGVSASDSENDFAYGFGANYSFNPRMYVGADWMRYLDKDGLKVDGVTISLGYRF